MVITNGLEGPGLDGGVLEVVLNTNAVVRMVDRVEGLMLVVRVVPGVDADTDDDNAATVEEIEVLVVDSAVDDVVGPIELLVALLDTDVLDVAVVRPPTGLLLEVAELVVDAGPGEVELGVVVDPPDDVLAPDDTLVPDDALVPRDDKVLEVLDVGITDPLPEL